VAQGLAALTVRVKKSRYFLLLDLIVERFKILEIQLQSCL